MRNVLTFCFSIFVFAEASLKIDQNHDEVTVRLGESADLTCTSKVDFNNCVFVRPDGSSFNVYAGVT